jgi:hypothetical protein
MRPEIRPDEDTPVLARRTYYQVLGVDREALPAVIEQAYRKRRHDDEFRYESTEIDRAHSVLGDPALRRLYDISLGQPDQSPCAEARAPRPRLVDGVSGSDPKRRLLAATLALSATCVAVFVLVVWPFIGWRLTRYAPGSELRSRSDGGHYGVILAYEPNHSFPTGTRLPAYRVRLGTGVAEVWLSRDEVNQVARPASRGESKGESNHE